MGEHNLPAMDWASHRSRTVDRLQGDFIMVLFSGPEIPKTADELYPFCPNRNFYYVTGLDRPRQCVVVSRRGGVVEEAAFIEPVSPMAELWTGKMMTQDDARERSGIASVHPIAQFERHVNHRLQTGHYERVYLDLEQRTWEGPPSAAHQFAYEVNRRHPGIRIENVYPTIARERRLKSPPEMARVRAAVAATHKGFTAILSALQPGVHEYQLEAEFQHALRQDGVVPGYASIVAAGVNATCMHYTTLRDQVGSEDLVLVDAAAEYDAYKADITRTFPSTGRFSSRQRAVYEVVLEASQETISRIAPGVAHAELNRATRRILARGLRTLGLIREDSELDRYYYYNVSHYLGLDTHDVGEYEELMPGMVLTVEPGLYIADERIGVRIEDDVAVTDSGAEVLSRHVPSTPDAVESWMADARSRRSQHV